jgi:hypothetical protein
MSKNIEQIHEFQFNQRLNILKGFKEVSGTAPLPIEDLRKSLGDEPLYTVENLEKYTKDVLTKGNENDIQKAKEVLNSLSCREVIDENGYVQNMYFYVEKGHMDFDGSSGGGGKQGLVKKQITDKTGRNTTKWVRANKDDEKQDKTPKAEEGTESKDKNPEVSSEKDSGQKESLINRELSTEEYASHAAGTDSEQLKAFLQKNPNAPGAAEAKAELQKRGELDSEDEGGIDFNDPESVKNALASHPDREAIIDSAIENGITPAQALKMHESNKTDHSETHAAIDGAQAALDALKEKTGHPGSSDEGSEDRGKPDFSEDTNSYGIVDEDGNEVGNDFLMQMYESANDVDDFVKKVNYGITNENSSVSYENDSALEEFFFDMEESNSEGSEKDQSEEEPGKTTEDTKDLVNEHKDLVDTLESDSHEDDKEEAVKQKKELKDLEKEQDNDGHDDDGDGKDEDGASSEDLDEDKIGEWASGGLELSKEQVQKYLDENPDSDFKDEMENFLSGEDDEDEVVDSKDSKFSQDELKKMAKNAPVQTLKAIAKMKTHTSRQIAIDELKERGEDVSEYEQVI